MKQIQGYQCEFCGEIYETPEAAFHCEKGHSGLPGLEIVNVLYQKDPMERFPEHIIVADNNYSGVVARYVKRAEGSAEDDYFDLDKG